VAYVSQDKAMSEAIAAMWKDVGVNVKVEVIEYSVRAQKNREKSFKGVWWADPTSTLGDPDGMMWRLLGPGGITDYWRDPKFDELGNARPLLGGREVPRGGLSRDDQGLQ
jgi:ABC-type transport system substrate-binding protein